LLFGRGGRRKMRFWFLEMRERERKRGSRKLFELELGCFQMVENGEKRKEEELSRFATRLESTFPPTPTQQRIETFESQSSKRSSTRK